MRASEAVKSRKQSFYIEREKVRLAALQERWPEPERKAALQLVAMISVSAFRLALDQFNAEGGRRPLTEVLHDTFDILEAELRTT